MTPPWESALVERLRALGSLAVGFSGGVDSGLLSDLATEALGDQALVVTAVSPSLPSAERAEAAAVAASRGWNHLEVHTTELENPDYRRNDPDRCFHCRTEFFRVLDPVRADHGIDYAAVGVVADDLGEHRPGFGAIRDAGVLTPFADAGVTKANVRDAARRRGLPLWDKPASACLSSRVPYGTPVTADVLAQVEAAEDALHRLGFDVSRVRHHGQCARVEVPVEDLSEALRRREEITLSLRLAGYTWVALDLDGFRSGSLNEDLGGSARITP